MPYMAPNIRPLPVPAKIQRAPNHSSEEHYIYIYILCQERMCKERACPYMYAYICIVCMCICIYACFESGKPFEKKPRSYKAVV